jgi:hypothetical protein
MNILKLFNLQYNSIYNEKNFNTKFDHHFY